MRSKFIEGWVMVDDDQGDRAYIVKIYNVRGRWELRYLVDFESPFHIRLNLTATDVVDFLVTSPIGCHNLSDTLINLDPQVSAMLLAQELEL